MKYLKGINRDVGPTSQPEGTYRFANNAVLKKDYGAIANESGTNQFTAKEFIIGECALDDGSIILFEACDPIVAPTCTHKIVKYTKHGALEMVLLSRADLNFDPKFPIQAVAKRIADDYVVYWTDNNNRPATLNINRQITALTTGSNSAIIYGDTSKDINNLSILSYTGSVPVVNTARVEEGGNLQTGTYYLALAYMGLDRVTTNYITISNALYVPGSKDTYSWTNLVGTASGITSNKQVVFEVTNLNQSFEFIQPVIIRKAAGGYDAFKLTAQRIEASSARVIFSGSENYATASPAEVIIDYPVYEKAKTLEIVDSVLYLGNLEGSMDIGYQPFANAIELEATTKHILNFEDIEYQKETLTNNETPPINKMSYRHAQLSYMQKGYTREEVYAFYIVWVLKDGRESYGYHIPGRTSANATSSGFGGELDNVSTPTTPTEKNMNNIYNFHMYSWEDNTNYVNNMGYWENQDEKYPNSDTYKTKDVTAAGGEIPHPTKPDLQGLPVRHHHFPSNKFCKDSSELDPIVSNSYSSSFTTGVDVVDTVAAVNYDLGSSTVKDHFGQIPPMGNRIAIDEPEGLIRFEIRNITDDPTGATPYYQDPMLQNPGATVDWFDRVQGQDWIHFQNWTTNNASPTQDEIDFIAAMNAVGPFFYGGTAPPGNTPLSFSAFLDGYMEPYGYAQNQPNSTVAQVIANPTPYHYTNTIMGTSAWGYPYGIPPFEYQPGVNDHANCTDSVGNLFPPYGLSACCPPPCAPPCSCGYPPNGTWKYDRRQQAIYFRQWYTGAMPNYLNYDISFEVRWVGSGTIQTPTTNNPGFAPSDVNILGFHLNNIKVPSHIADRVQGFRIYRAERDWQNKRVWGQSPAINMRKVGGTFENGFSLALFRGAFTPWPSDPAVTVPASSWPITPHNDGTTTPSGFGKSSTSTAWIRTANPESNEGLYQADNGNLEFGNTGPNYMNEHTNGGYTLYDFTLMRQLKNIRPVSYLSLVHYTKNAVFSSMNGLGIKHMTAHCTMKFEPKREARFIRNRAITYQSGYDLEGAQGLGFTCDRIVGSGFDNVYDGQERFGWSSITCEIAPHDPDWNTAGVFPSGDEIYFNHSGKGSSKAWEDHPGWNEHYVAWNALSFNPPTYTFPVASSNVLYPNSGSDTSYVPLVNLNSLKYNVYSRWNTQKLIQTGYFCPVENFDPRNPSATFSTKAIYADGIFGGDTFICRTGVLAGHMNNYGIGGTSSTTWQPTGSFKTLNPPPLQIKALYCTMVESTDNINFRYENYDNASNLYKCWPASSAVAVLGQEMTYDANAQVGFGYDEVYSADNDVRYALALPFLDDVMDKFPNRIIKSNVDSQTRMDSNRIFLANNYKDISTSQGPITTLLNFSNLLYIHCTRSLFATKGKQTVQLSDSSEAFIGSGDIFQQEPAQILSVDHGYGGVQSIFACKSTRYGYFFLDKLAGKVFQHDGELTEISKLGLEKLFKSVAGNPLVPYGYDIGANGDETIFDDIGATLGWDPEYDRLLVSVHHYSPTENFINGWNILGPYTSNSGAGGIRWDSHNGHFSVFSNDGGVPVWTEIEFSNYLYFNNESFTVSYYPEFKMWGSFHDYSPYLYFNNYINMYSHPGISGYFFDHKRHNFPGNIYQGFAQAATIGEFEFEYVVNVGPEMNKLFYNVQYDVQVKDAATVPITSVDSPIHDPGFDSFYVYNSKQICDETAITALVNARVIDTSVVLNQFRDDTDFTGSVLPNVAMFTDNLRGVINNSYINVSKTADTRSRFVDKYLIIRLKYSNSTNNLLNLYSANAGYRQNHR